jgi:peroxiredoxin 2/4
VFFSHPADFSPVCTTEFVSLAKSYDRFVALECALLALSVDSLYSHLAWMRAIRDVFDIEVPFPVVEDP